MARRRVLIVSDTSGRWYTRRVRTVVHNLARDEKVYFADKHLGGPYRSAIEAVKALGARDA